MKQENKSRFIEYGIEYEGSILHVKEESVPDSFQNTTQPTIESNRILIVDMEELVDNYKKIKSNDNDSHSMV